MLVGECGDSPMACRLAADLTPDVVLSGFHLAGCNGIALVRELGRTVPSARVLFLASDGPEAIVYRTLGAGACGYSVTEQSPAEVVTAIRSVLLVRLVLPPGVAAPAPRAVGAGPEKNSGTRAIERLSHALQIVNLVVWGSSNKQIAGEF